MIQYRSALVVSAPLGSNMRFQSPETLPSPEPVRANSSSFDSQAAAPKATGPKAIGSKVTDPNTASPTAASPTATASIAMFGRAWIHLSKRPER